LLLQKWLSSLLGRNGDQETGKDVKNLPDSLQQVSSDNDKEEDNDGPKRCC
jgi:hypothetical protein